jgi:ribosomal protein S18 acetylase RimI-like enzyme
VSRLEPDERFAHARPRSAASKVSQLDLPEDPVPFQWSIPDCRTAYIEMVHVDNRFRGKGIATTLLRTVVDAMRRDGVSRAEAHIDATNYASMRAFLNADWKVVRTSTRDFKALWTAETDAQ